MDNPETPGSNGHNTQKINKNKKLERWANGPHQEPGGEHICSRRLSSSCFL